jgi:hypothetical protein
MSEMVRKVLEQIWGRGERMRNRKWTGVFMRRKRGPLPVAVCKGFSSHFLISALLQGEPPSQFEFEFSG